MSASQFTMEKYNSRPRASDFSFEVLLKLKSDGKTTRELMGMLPDAITYGAVSTCLENLLRLGLLYRIRSGRTYEWWANGEGIANAAALLANCAAMIPRRDLETISKLSGENAFVARVAGFFSVPGRVDILQAVCYRPLAMQDIFERISLHVTPSRLGVLLQTLEELGLISSNAELIRKEVGGFLCKKYQIKRKGRIVLDALLGARPLRDVLKDETSPW